MAAVPCIDQPPTDLPTDRDLWRMLTVRQPWADWLVPDAGVVERLHAIQPELAGLLPKDVENRSYPTSWRGPTIIHAAGRVDRDAMLRYNLDPNRFVRGAVIGILDLADCVQDADSPWTFDGQWYWLPGDDPGPTDSQSVVHSRYTTATMSRKVPAGPG